VLDAERAQEARSDARSKRSSGSATRLRLVCERKDRKKGRAMDDDLTDLGDELAMDENVATTLERFEMAWSPCLPMQLTWLTYEMAETLELIGRGDLRDIGSRMERHEINRTVAIMAGLAHL